MALLRVKFCSSLPGKVFRYASELNRFSTFLPPGSFNSYLLGYISIVILVGLRARYLYYIVPPWDIMNREG